MQLHIEAGWKLALNIVQTGIIPTLRTYQRTGVSTGVGTSM